MIWLLVASWSLGVLYGLVWLLRNVRWPDPTPQPKVDWRRVAELETEIYGHVVSEQAVPPPPPASTALLPRFGLSGREAAEGLRSVLSGREAAERMRAGLSGRPGPGPWRVGHRVPYDARGVYAGEHHGYDPPQVERWEEPGSVLVTYVAHRLDGTSRKIVVPRNQAALMSEETMARLLRQELE